MKEYKFWHKDNFQLVKNLNSIDTGTEHADVIAVLEYPYIDIELIDRGIEQEDYYNDIKRYYDYYCCIKQGDNEGDWGSYDSVEFEKQPYTFNSWAELEEDMNKQLLKFAKEHNLKLFKHN